MIGWVGLYRVGEKDEFVRMQNMLGLLGALGFILALTTVWGFLQNFAGLPPLDLWWIFPMYACALCKLLVRWWRR